MIFRQLFDHETFTYTYLIADEETKEAVFIDTVKDKLPHYLTLLQDLGLVLRYALETHVHADHITAAGELRAETGCETVLSHRSAVECASIKVKDGEVISVGHEKFQVLETPGHTDDSLCYLLTSQQPNLVFTGDTLLIRGTGRTDFQNGSAEDQYNSLFNKLLNLHADTIVYPGHDYKGWTSSTLAEEIKHNPRLKYVEKADYINFMNNLDLPDPKFMDVAVPANLKCGNKG